MNTILKLVSVMIISTFLSGCASNRGFYQHYSGEPRPASEIAYVKGHYAYRNGSIANDMIRIIEVNGIPTPREWGKAEGVDTVALLPGRYTFKVLFFHGYETVDFYLYKTFPLVVAPQCSYEVVTEFNSINKTVSFDIIPTSLAGRSPDECITEFVVEDRAKA